MHAIEKMLARAANRIEVKAGELVTCRIDFAEINDLYLQTVYSFWEMGGEKVWDKDKATFVFDHYAPAPTIKTARIHEEMRAFAASNGLKHHFDVNEGVCHQVMPEAGLVYPGMVLVATDSHTTTHGAFGAFGTGIGATDMATVLISGELWFKVPEVMRIELKGETQEGVYPKDVVLKILGELKADAAVYMAVEFYGSYVENLGVAGRMTICNMAVEMGAKTAYMKPNEEVLEYVKGRRKETFILDETDEDYRYAKEYAFDVDSIEPQVAVPHSVDNVFPIGQVEAVRVNQAFIGSCTGGRLEDLKAAFEILKGKRISPHVRLIVIPSSREVLVKAMEAGYVTELIKAGAVFSSPGCGPCLGTHQGLLSEGEICVSSTNRNFPGRMGSAKASIYLASPATVAMSALKGFLADPREKKEDLES